MYSCDANGKELLISVDNGSEDLDVARAWRMYGVKCDEVLLKSAEHTLVKN